MKIVKKRAKMTVEGLICGQAMTKKMKKRLRLRMKKIVHSLTMSRAVKTTPPFIEVDRERRQQLRQTRDQLEELQDIVGGSEDVSDHKVLSQLDEKLNAYIQELPVLGFNSGKYDRMLPKNSFSRTSSSISPSNLL